MTTAKRVLYAMASLVCAARVGWAADHYVYPKLGDGAGTLVTDRPGFSFTTETVACGSSKPRAAGKVIGLPRVGGLHHRYERRAA